MASLFLFDSVVLGKIEVAYNYKFKSCYKKKFKSCSCFFILDIYVVICKLFYLVFHMMQFWRLIWLKAGTMLVCYYLLLKCYLNSRSQAQLDFDMIIHFLSSTTSNLLEPTSVQVLLRILALAGYCYWLHHGLMLTGT